jgi:hypothetical protein
MKSEVEMSELNFDGNLAAHLERAIRVDQNQKGESQL